MGCTFSGSKQAASESTQIGSSMFKFVFSAVVCAAMCLPATSFAQDCGCDPAPTPCCEPAPAPCVKTRKRLKLVDVQQQVCRLKRVCTTDACGCPKSSLVKVQQCVTRKKLTVVETPVDPCRQGILKRLRGRLGSVGCKSACGCAAPAPAPCGCDAPAPCGCDAAPAPMVESIPMAIPTPAAPCCGG